jgi:hypothetical protein
MSLITTKPTIYLVNLTMKDYLRQKSKYLPLIAKWVTEHGGLPRDIIPFSIEFEEKIFKMRGEPEALAKFLEESKVKSRLEKIVTEGLSPLHFLSPAHSYCHSTTCHLNPKTRKESKAETLMYLFPNRVHQARLAILLHRGREGDPLLDHPPRMPRTPSRRRHPR